MLSRRQRFKLLLLLALAQVSCVAVGLCVYHGLAVSGVRWAADREASEQLASSTGRLLAAVRQTAEGGPAAEPADVEAIRRCLRSQPPVPDVHWLVADPQWRVVAILGRREAEPSARPAQGNELSWISPPRKTARDAAWSSGTLMVDGRRHAAVAFPLPGRQRYVVAHRAVEPIELAPAALNRSLLVAGVMAWVWTSVLLGFAVSLILSKLYDQLSQKHAQAETEALRRIQSLIRTRDALIFGLARVAESRDEITGRHVERVSFYACRLATAASHHPKFRAAITPDFIRRLAVASVLHDIGKVGIEDAILFKPGRLTDTERARMQKHATIGADHLAEIQQRLGDASLLEMARQIVLHHHERWDGSGYPDGQAGEDIPLAARIVAVADVYEALSSPRPYKPPYPHEKCVAMIRREAGKHFDPALVDAFLRVEASFRQIACQYGEHVFDESEAAVTEPQTSQQAERAAVAPAVPTLDGNQTVPTASPSAG